MKRSRTSRTIGTPALTTGALNLTLGLPGAPAGAADGKRRTDTWMPVVSGGCPATASGAAAPVTAPAGVAASALDVPLPNGFSTPVTPGHVQRG
ncbi:hypothetical protein [Streptomyces sp. NPDC127084]|uniref:hypothetical protein n=1 Tax=Streptomyces sp. NPDC127084 TaxID=3347133 RepID=UPI0036545FCD